MNAFLRFIVLSPALLSATSFPALRNFDFSVATRPLALQYTLQRHGISALRSLKTTDFWLFGTHETPSKIAQAIWLLICGYGDAAHEVLLGVNATNQDIAEYAATHPGQTSWHQDHPLEDVNDLVHSLIHRYEGDFMGEGGHSGFENAKYWAAGGPKEYKNFGNTDAASSVSLIHKALLQWSSLHTPKIAADVVSTNSARIHSIIASGGKRRQVVVAPGCWDPFAFIDLCSTAEQLSSLEQDQLKILQEFELRLLLRYVLLEQRGCDLEILLSGEEQQ
ncbi:hypothetical protein FisN_2Lh146 [Fistulifera solaris]|uniref:Uncharacterized protein n=1 Tax=Fistulifera solaris TaxID=1519565 RepID=A0A1Z5KFH1_FISSO|nr:hypothetical protein FisN_2Lh146 [Fistulifera solaris]|eukprot:GAX24875.1 hypothetical protein FisN_2Lh146 [Fistulifera solaris]